MASVNEAIARERLSRQRLVTPTLVGAADVVRALGAVQAQDYANAKWALGQRTRGVTDADVEAAIASGAIIRTHVLRPTWHFVAPEDVRWMLALTAPRVSAAMASYNRKLGLDGGVFRKSNAALARALRDGNQLSRPELVKVLAGAGVGVPTGQHVGHLLMQGELDGVICSGARRGKQLTYALLDERVPGTRVWGRDESLVELTRRYFATRGPATLQDFSWWSGLTAAEARRGIEAAGSSLERVTSDGRTWWSPPSSGATRRRSTGTAHLLPNYDEYFIGFKDRGAIGERLRRSVANPRVDALMGHVLFVDGQIVGGWRRTLGKHVDVELEVLVPLSAPERTLIAAAAERLGKFLGLPVRLHGME